MIEFHKVIGPLTDPAAHGGDPADAFHLVMPSLPGYGFSDRPARRGWSVERIARTWIELMERLGYARFVAQGGDWGSAVISPIGASGAGRGGDPPQHGGRPAIGRGHDGPYRAEKTALEDLTRFRTSGSGYWPSKVRPQTLGYGLTTRRRGKRNGSSRSSPNGPTAAAIR